MEVSSLQRWIFWLRRLFFVVLPWQTAWIMQEQLFMGEKWQLGTLLIYGSEILFGVYMIIWGIWFWKQQHVDSKKISFFWVSMVVLVYGILRSFFTSQEALAFQQVRWFAEGFLFLLSIIYLTFKKDDVLWFVLGGIAPALLGIWQFITQKTIASTWLGLSQYFPWEGGVAVVSDTTFGRWLRAYGSFAHPNMFGGYLVTLLFGVLLLCMHYLRQHKQLGLQYMAIFFLFFTALFFSFSRSAWVAASVLIGIFVVFLYKKRKDQLKKWIALSFCWGVMLTLLLLPLVTSRIFSRGSIEVRSISERESALVTATEMILDHLFFGVGVGQYTVVMPSYQGIAPGWALQPVHNVPMLFFAEWGIIGIILFAVAFIFFVRLSPQTKPRTWILFIPLLVLLLLDHYLYTSWSGVVLMVMFALFAWQFFPQCVHNLSTDTLSS